MYSNPGGRMPHKYANGWMTVLALGLLALSLLACLFVFLGAPAEAQVNTFPTTSQPAAPAPDTAAQTPNAPPAGATAAPTAGPPLTSEPSPTEPAPAPRYAPAQSAPVQPAPVQSAPVQPAIPIRRRQIPVYVLQSPILEQQLAAQTPAASARTDALAAQFETQLNSVKDQLTQSRDALRQAQQSQHQSREMLVIFLAVFAVIAALIVVQVYIQVRGWDREAMRGGEEVDELRKQVESLQDAGNEFRNTLPALLQEVGEQHLSYQEEGTAFAPKALTMIEDIDHLAYVGQGRLAFRDLPSGSEAAVYLNGLLLSAVAQLTRSNPWAAYSRLEQFFSHLAQFPNVIERLRVAQGYSYRALAAYQVLQSQHKEPSWLRKAERAQLDSLTKQAFADVAQAAVIDPEWKHSTFVEALLCSRFFVAEEGGDDSGRGELVVRGLRRAVSLYKGLIDERSYRGPSRRNLVRALKQIAEQTGEKSDFSDFGYALNAFPTDEELADEALAARQPNSQDRFLWQWLMGDEELFARVDRLNLAEYRAFWVRMLDNKVNLRNWRSDLVELQHANPAMQGWSIQLLQGEAPIALSSAVTRRLERYDNSFTGG